MNVFRPCKQRFAPHPKKLSVLECSTLLQKTFYPVARSVLPYCAECSTLLRRMFYPVAKRSSDQRENQAGTRGLEHIEQQQQGCCSIGNVVALGRNVAELRTEKDGAGQVESDPVKAGPEAEFRQILRRAPKFGGVSAPILPQNGP